MKIHLYLFNKEPKKSLSNIDHQIYSTNCALNLQKKKVLNIQLKQEQIFELIKIT